MTPYRFWQYCAMLCACTLALGFIPAAIGQTNESGDRLMLDLGIVIEGTDSAGANTDNTTKVLTISAMPGGAAYVQSTKELRSMLDDLRTVIVQLESSLDGDVDQVRLENQRLRELLNKLQGQNAAPTKQPEQIMADLKKREVPVESSQEMYQVPTDWHEVMKAYRAGDYPGVVNLCDNLPAALPDYWQPDQVAYWCGDAYFSVGRIENALGMLESITSKDSQVLDDAIILAGLILMKQGRTGEARDHFQRILDHYPESDYHRLAGLTLKELK